MVARQFSPVSVCVCAARASFHASRVRAVMAPSGFRGVAHAVRIYRYTVIFGFPSLDRVVSFFYREYQRRRERSYPAAGEPRVERLDVGQIIKNSCCSPRNSSPLSSRGSARSGSAISPLLSCRIFKRERERERPTRGSAARRKIAESERKRERERGLLIRSLPPSLQSIEDFPGLSVHARCPHANRSRGI